MFWSYGTVRRILKKKNPKFSWNILRCQYNWRKWTTRSLFELSSFHRNVLISKWQLSKHWKLEEQHSFLWNLKKKVFLISIIDWKTVNMFVTFKKPQMNFSEKPNVFLKKSTKLGLCQSMSVTKPCTTCPLRFTLITKARIKLLAIWSQKDQTWIQMLALVFGQVPSFLFNLCLLIH